MAVFENSPAADPEGVLATLRTGGGEPKLCAEGSDTSSVQENKSIHSLLQLWVAFLTRRCSDVGALQGDTQAGRGLWKGSLGGSPGKFTDCLI